MGQIKPSPATPKPAIRSSFPAHDNKYDNKNQPLQENRNFTNNEDSEITSIKNKIKNFEIKDDLDGICEEQLEKTDEEPETKPSGVSISELRKNWEAKEEHQQESEEEIEENASKMASIRKQFENRSISVDEKIVERRREEVRQEITIQ